VKGVYFSVWAPHAKKVSVIGNFNNWNHKDHILFPRWDESGIWEGFIEGLPGGLYINMPLKRRAEKF
jgi:1,4-alpha-glucan branching enzyme